MFPAILPPWLAICERFRVPAMESNPSRLWTCFRKRFIWRRWLRCVAPDPLFTGAPPRAARHASGTYYLRAPVLNCFHGGPESPRKRHSSLSRGMVVFPGHCLDAGHVWPAAAVVPAMIAALLLHCGVWAGSRIRFLRAGRFSNSRAARVAVRGLLRFARRGDGVGTWRPEAGSARSQFQSAVSS